MPRQPKPRRLTVTRYVLPDGTRATKATPGARQVRTKTETYYVTLPGERKPTSLGTSDEAEAWSRLRDMLRDRAERAAGILTPEIEAARLPLEVHVAAWQASLLAKGTDKEHVTTVGSHVRRLAVIAGWRQLTDISSEGALYALAVLREEGKAARTRNHYLAHLKEFCRWCCATTPRRLRDNPVAGLKRVSVEADLRRPHRMPTLEELLRLFRWLGTGREPTHARQHTTYPSDDTAPVRRYLSGPSRALGYRLAMGTGLRAAEIRSLRRESFDLAGGSVVVAAGYSKHRRRDVQPLPDWLRDELREHFARPDARDWRTLNDGGEGRSKNLLRSDLEDAGLEYETAEGFLTLHSLRVWYITRLAADPANTVKQVMELARHSTPYLTLAVYARVRADELREATDRLANPRE